MNQLTDFGNRLKSAREARALSVVEIARVTKIPERSLQLMEDGRFDRLPGDVFVRGFLRSYARCVGLDPDETVRSYGALATHPAAFAARAGAVPVVVTPRAVEAPAAPPVATPPAAAPAGPAAPTTSAGGAGAPAPETPSPHDVSHLARSLLDVGIGPRRMSLTLAVIILVIVATLTLSLLLRRPSHVGDGLSLAPATPVVAEVSG